MAEPMNKLITDEQLEKVAGGVWDPYDRYASINESLCDRCGECQDHCRFGAIKSDLSIDTAVCDGCGECASFCPRKAISIVAVITEDWE